MRETNEKKDDNRNQIRVLGMATDHYRAIMASMEEPKPVNRKITYRLYPTHQQEAALLEMKRRHQQLYNAALEERIKAYRMCGVSVGYCQQCAELTELRALMAEYAELNAQSMQVTLKRLDLAFAAFFQRVKEVAPSPGFPRFVRHSKLSVVEAKPQSGERRTRSPSGFHPAVPT